MNCSSLQRLALFLVTSLALFTFFREQTYLHEFHTELNDVFPWSVRLAEYAANSWATHLRSGQEIGWKGRTLSSRELEAAHTCEEERSSTVTISHKNFAYCYPSSFSEIVRAQKSDTVLLVGVLTAADNRSRRDLIRGTWAKGHHVYFLVGGDLKGTLAEEFLTFGDIIWFSGSDEYESLTYKTQMFLHVAHKHVVDYDYIFKTDDDCFMNVAKTEKALAVKKPKYYGCCIYGQPVLREPTHHRNYVSKEMFSPDTYPTYASGAGYALSKKFNACVVRKLPSAKFITNEDAGLGIIAKQCKVDCTLDDKIKPWKSTKILYQKVDNVEEMRFIHNVLTKGS